MPNQSPVRYIDLVGFYWETMIKYRGLNYKQHLYIKARVKKSPIRKQKLWTQMLYKWSGSQKVSRQSLILSPYDENVNCMTHVWTARVDCTSRL